MWVYRHIDRRHDDWIKIREKFANLSEVEEYFRRADRKYVPLHPQPDQTWKTNCGTFIIRNDGPKTMDPVWSLDEIELARKFITENK